MGVDRKTIHLDLNLESNLWVTANKTRKWRRGEMSPNVAFRQILSNLYSIITYKINNAIIYDDSNRSLIYLRDYRNVYKSKRVRFAPVSFPLRTAIFCFT